MYRIILFCFVAAVSLTHVVAQPPETVELRTVVPPSPNTAALGKYGETPVSMYTGVPEITIPIYEINTGRIKVPVSLSYHAGGIKVEESASSVGLGWTLMAGGMISRTVRGRPDDDGATSGYFNYYDSMTVKRLLQGPDNPSNIDSVRYYNGKLLDAVERNTDGEPDLFQLNAPGLSFKFYYNQEQKKFYTNPASKIKITFTGSSLSNSSWEVVNTNGVIYHFNATESTTVPWDLRIGSQAMITAWLLDHIEDPLTGRNVFFTYQSVSSSQYLNGISEVHYFPMSTGATEDGPHFILQSSQVQQLRLRKITFDEGEVNFLAQSVKRKDFPVDTALKEINVKNYLGQTVRRCELKTSYFNGGGMSIPPPNGNLLDSMYNFRLKLDSVIFLDDGNVPSGIYHFEYNEAMTNRLSVDQDYWGYYNQANNTHLLKDEYMEVGAVLVHLPGGNRNVSTTANQMAILKKITYPTGGYTEFEYESNRYSVSTPNGGYQSANMTQFIEIQPSPLGTLNGVPYSYTELPFTVYGRTNCGTNEAVTAWGEIVQLNEEAEFCPSHLKFIELRVIGTDANTDEIDVALNGSAFPVELPPGAYKLVMSLAHCDSNYFYMAQGMLHYTDCLLIDSNATYSNHYVGGLRIKSIIDHDHVANISSKKTYDYSIESTPGFSSGSIPADMPNYYMVSRKEDDIANVYYKRTSYSAIPLSTTKGSPIGYARVTEKLWDGEQLKGYTVFEYAGFNVYPNIDTASNQYPFLPVTNRDYMRGLLTSKKIYGIKPDNNPYLIHETTHEYEEIEDTTQSSISYGIIGAALIADAIFEGPLPYNDVMDSPPMTGVYKEFFDLPLLIKTTETIKGRETPSNAMTTITDYEHSQYNFLTKRITKYLSNDTTDKEIVEMKYPHDYFVSSSLAIDNYMLAIKELRDENMIDEIIETSAYNYKDAAKKLTASNVNYFKTQSRLITQVSKLENSEPLTVSAASSNQAGYFTTISEIKPALELLKYDDNKNLVSQRLHNNVTETYVWDHYASPPIAKCVNADTSSIAYTSFEGDGKGNWTFTGAASSDVTAPMGSKRYLVSGGQITKTGLPSATYIVSYWGKTGSVSVNSGGPTRTGKTIDGWTYHEHELTTTSITVSGSNYIDELRLYPKGSFMTTYTYAPLIGMTSQCDAGGRITYYEYDNFGRLRRIKDQDKNIIKIIDYQFTQSQNQ